MPVTTVVRTLILISFLGVIVCLLFLRGYEIHFCLLQTGHLLEIKNNRCEDRQMYHMSVIIVVCIISMLNQEVVLERQTNTGTFFSC